MYADRVKDTTTSTGSGAITLANLPPTGFKSFAAGFNNATTLVSYVIVGGSEWETGIGTFNGTTNLTRDTVLSSSNNNTLVTFSTGTKEVFCSISANTLSSFKTQAEVLATVLSF